jgi:hypothetical protein
VIDEAECAAFRNEDAGGAGATSANPSLAAPSSAEDLVHRFYFEGIPYELARQLDPASAVPRLLEMLRDPGERPYRTNIVVVLGMVGDASVFDPLSEFIRGDGSAEDAEEHRARTAAVMALGYVLHRTGEARILEYLTAGTRPETWSARGLTGVAPGLTDTADRDRSFARHAILGLALAATPEAIATLEALRPAPGFTADARLLASFQGLVTGALAESRAIAADGLARYYAERRTRR